MSAMSPLFLGVDGGGTGCRARIEDNSGIVLGLGQSGPATTRLGIDRVWDSVQAAFTTAFTEARLGTSDARRIHAAVGIAGMGRKGTCERLTEVAHPFASVRFVSDSLIACLGAHGGKDGGIIVVGTGSIGLACIKGRNLRVGGYGFPISDEGSGADLGLHALRSALRAFDGRGEASSLTAEILERFHHDPFEVVAWMDCATATDYATFAPLVMRHAEQGDAVGRGIVQCAAQQIDTLVRVLFDRGAPRVALIGGLASAIQAWLAPDLRFRLSTPEGDAISGAIILARQGG